MSSGEALTDLPATRRCSPNKYRLAEPALQQFGVKSNLMIPLPDGRGSDGYVLDPCPSVVYASFVDSDETTKCTKDTKSSE